MKPLLQQNRSSGFTLIELMVVIAILAIVAGLAGPNFSAMLANYRVRTGADGILTGLQLARMEAVRRNTNVSFTLDASGTGWTVAVVDPATTIQRRPASEARTNLQVTPFKDQRALTFTPLGAVAGYNVDTNLTTVTIAPSAGSSGTEQFQIDVFAGGQMRMCNPNIDKANDPRRC